MAVKFTKPEINVREKLAELDKPSGIAGEAMLRAETPQEQFNLIGAGRRNFTINGDMKVWQRGTSFTTTNSSDYFADRWTMGSNVSNLTISRNTGVAVGPFPKKNTLRMEATGASNFDLYQLYEEWEALSNQTVTISFWYKTNVEGVTIRQWSTASYDTVPTSEDWSYYTTTFTLGTLVTGARAANTASFGLWATSGIASGGYFEFTNYQLEIGTVATPFEHRSYGEELALCQRYCHVVGHPSQVTYLGSGSMYTTTAVNLSVPLPATMRSSSLSITKVVNSSSVWLNLYVGSTGTSSNTTPQQGDYSNNNVRLYCTGAHSGNSPSAAGAGVWAMVLAGAKIIFSAEL